MYPVLVRKLLAAAMEASPTDEIRANFTDMVYDMSNDGLDARTIGKAILGGMQDGLNHGNWPAVQPKHPNGCRCSKATD